MHADRRVCEVAERYRPVQPRSGLSSALPSARIADSCRWRSSGVEQLICNQRVGGSNPLASSRPGLSARLLRWRCSDRACGQKDLAGLMWQRERGGIQTLRDIAGVLYHGEIPEWSKGTDCKSVAVRLRRFESSSPHQTDQQVWGGTSSMGGNSSVGRASAFQAEGRGFESRFPLQLKFEVENRRPRGSGVEHFLGKEGVIGSNPIVGSTSGCLDWPGPGGRDEDTALGAREEWA
jgi:hypothetical protein